MEQLLHYIWKHKLFPLTELKTTDGRTVEVIDTGLQNRNSGPDFFNAKVKIDGTLWVGNVEIHTKSSDWYIHGHDHDSHYNNVVLHIAEDTDVNIITADGKKLPQMQLTIPDRIAECYNELISTDHYPPCWRIIKSLPDIMTHSWMSALQTERLEQKTKEITQRVDECGGSWEDAYFRTLARNFGFGVNSEGFDAWAKAIPLLSAAHHRNDSFQIEAIFMGQAGLLDTEKMTEKQRNAAESDDYFNSLRKEYLYLAHKFKLTPMDVRLWRFLRLRPQNFPHIRISQLVSLYFRNKTGLASLTECTTIKEVEELMDTGVTDYWKTHYLFGMESKENSKRLSLASRHLIIINTATPMLFAYGRHKMSEKLCDRAIDLLSQLRAEDNNIVRMWQECGLKVNNANDSQALIQLKKMYCDRKDCLRCRIGYEYLKPQPKLL